LVACPGVVRIDNRNGAPIPAQGLPGGRRLGHGRQSADPVCARCKRVDRRVTSTNRGLLLTAGWVWYGAVFRWLLINLYFCRYY